MRVFVAGFCLVTGAALLVADATACGDKLLVLGRHPRSQRAHGAVQRASILVFLDDRGQLEAALREMRLERDLRLAGHRLRFVSSTGELIEEVRSGDHDLLMAEITQASAFPAGLLASPGSPTVLPVIVNETGEEWPEAEATFSCVRRSPNLGKHHLAVIEKLMRQRQAQEKARARP
jgi:hypothetical protein